MPHPSKTKGTGYERELVNELRSHGLRAERAYASNGESLHTDEGEKCSASVDVLVNGSLKLQARRRRAIASYLLPPQGADGCVFRMDRGESYALVPLSLLIELITEAARCT